MLKIFFCPGNILKKNVYINKIVDAHGSPLGMKTFFKILQKITTYFSLVTEIKYEKIPAILDGNDFNLSKEFKFHIPPSSDYFTR